MTREELLKALGAALGDEDASAAVRGLLLDALAKGVGRPTLMGWLNEGREMFPSDDEAILEAMDQLEEWPGPRGRPW